MGEYISFFEPYLQGGKDILHITLSSGLAGSYISVVNARDELLQKYIQKVAAQPGHLSSTGTLVLFWRELAV